MEAFCGLNGGWAVLFFFDARLLVARVLHYRVYLCISLTVGVVWVDERGATCSPHHGVLLFRPEERDTQKAWYKCCTRKFIPHAKLCLIELTHMQN